MMICRLMLFSLLTVNIFATKKQNSNKRSSIKLPCDKERSLYQKRVISKKRLETVLGLWGTFVLIRELEDLENKYAALSLEEKDKVVDRIGRSDWDQF